MVRTTVAASSAGAIPCCGSDDGSIPREQLGCASLQTDLVIRRLSGKHLFQQFVQHSPARRAAGDLGDRPLLRVFGYAGTNLMIPCSGKMISFQLAATSAAVNGEPSANWTPSRILKL